MRLQQLLVSFPKKMRTIGILALKVRSFRSTKLGFPRFRELVAEVATSVSKKGFATFYRFNFSDFRHSSEGLVVCSLILGDYPLLRMQRTAETKNKQETSDAHLRWLEVKRKQCHKINDEGHTLLCLPLQTAVFIHQSETAPRPRRREAKRLKCVKLCGPVTRCA